MIKQYSPLGDAMNRNLQLFCRMFVLAALDERCGHFRRLSFIRRTRRGRYRAFQAAEKYGRLYHQRREQWTR